MDTNQDLDVFLSYEHTSKPIADRIVAALESRSIRCWYAPRNVRGGYAASIMGAISQCRAFVVVLDRRSSESPQVLNEVEAAYGRVMQDGLPIIPVRLDDQELNAEMLYYVKRLHWVDSFANGLDAAIEDLALRLFELMPDRKDLYEKSLAKNNPMLSRRHFNRDEASSDFELFSDVTPDEEHRRHLQGLIMKDFDQPIYDRIMQGQQEMAVLDVGCGNGEVIGDRLAPRREVAHVLGIDGNDEMLAAARDKFCDDSRFSFAKCDFEGPELSSVLSDYLDERGLQGFDFVTITMVIMDLKKPYILLRTIRRFLNDGAQIFIRDIDDGLNIAYPDKDGAFRRANDLCAALPDTGFRTTGRTLFNMLKRAGYEDIALDRSGLSTVGMDHDRRYALFITCFDWLGRGLKKRCDDEPNNVQYAEDLAWYEENIDELEESFQDPSFFYQEGFMIFTARSHRHRL